MSKIIKGQLEETVTVEKAVYKYGCILAEQIADFIPPLKKFESKENPHISIINHLISVRHIDMHEGILYPKQKLEYQQSMIDSLWVMLDYLKYVEDAPHPSNMLARSLIAEHPCTLTFIPTPKPMIKTLCIYDKTQITDVLFEQERYKTQDFGDDDEGNLLYLIIVKSEAVLDALGDLEIILPHKIAYMEQEGNNRPNIRYFSPE